jgi:hypothetical protein
MAGGLQKVIFKESPCLCLTIYQDTTQQTIHMQANILAIKHCLLKLNPVLLEGNE